VTTRASTPESDRGFVGSLPSIYQSHLVPLIFEPYARDLAGRLAERRPLRVLEIAAGTGSVTRAMVAALPDSVFITATDLNQGMLDQAAAVGTARPVEWRKADAMQLPFDDNAFDAVVCQFGVMFFPDRAKAFAESRRVLRPGGELLFSTWDRIQDNEFADVVTDALAERYPGDPPRFMARTPHGYTEPATILADVAAGGFTFRPSLTTLAERSRADSPETVAVAYCQGTPLRNEIEAREPGGLGPATEHAAQAIARRFGTGPVEGKIQAHVVVVEA